MAAEICFTCLRETPDPIPIADQAESAKVSTTGGTTSYRGVVLAKHFWFDLNDLIQGVLCGRCWSSIEEFHKFYCEIEEVHEQKLRLPFAEVKQEMVDGEQERNDSRNALRNLGGDDQDKAEEQVECTDPEDVSVFMQEEHLLDEDEEEDDKEEASQDDDEDFDLEAEEEDDEIPETVAKKPRKQSRKRVRHADKIAQGDELIANHCNMHCDECSQAFKSFNALQMHSASVHQKRAYVYCCDRRFNTRTRLYEHVLRHINPEQFQCDLCKRNCVDSEGLKRHKLKMHTPLEERTFKCDKCSKAFAQESVLNSHKRYHEAMENKEFPCGQCNKHFGNSALLKQHVKNSHTSTYEFVCDTCAKGFNQRGLFLKHLKDHGPKGPEDKGQCPICDQWLLKVSLNKHIMRHNSPSYRCETCGKDSPNILAHRSHVRFAHSDARFTCNFCGKVFKRALTLKEHIASHSGEVLYTCPHCPKTFNSNANMHSHRKKMHYQEWLNARQRIIVK
ncbi:transcription factor grauzone [Aedes albopictus]|uniref:C2H2-type domain-containing protein n=1 Tax=Aedes albopictus TaxID=7160 RepID=A0ABM1Z0A0_AEDAL|nr:transcription factor grauzone-like [Aedes albopictus]